MKPKFNIITAGLDPAMTKKEGAALMELLRPGQGPRYKHLVEEGAPYETVAIDKLTPIIGAEVGGVDLARPLGNRTVDCTSTRRRRTSRGNRN
jgi:hypothetical protein